MNRIIRYSILSGFAVGSLLATATASWGAPVPLNAQLQPLERLLGHWKSERREGGKLITGLATSRADLGGAIILTEGEDVSDGVVKLRFLEVNFWQPESKAFGYYWFDSNGEPGYGTVAVKGNRLCVLGNHFDLNGNPCAWLGQNEWKNRDTWVFQLTHNVQGTELKPNWRKVTNKRVAEGPSRATVPAPLCSELKALSRFLGDWFTEWDYEGRTYKGHLNVAPALGGKIAMVRWDLQQGGQPVNSSITIYYQRPESRQIAACEFTSIGDYSTGIMLKEGLLQQSGYAGDGKPTSSVLTAEWQDENIFVGQYKHVCVAGEPQPDSQKWVFKRGQL